MVQPTLDDAPGPGYVRAGQRFGRLVALTTVPRWHGMVLCRCDCGTEKEVQARGLTKGTSQSCGCLRAERVRAAYDRKSAARYDGPFIAAGDVFGRLTALEEALSGQRMILCQCECGRMRRVRAASLRGGRTTSCGCFNKERTAAAIKAAAPHGSMSTHPVYKTLYGIWGGVVARTTNPDHANYSDYGGRGIRIYEPWRTDPEAFVYWILENLGMRPEGKYPSGFPLYTLDRWPDNDGNYEPGNLRWATREEQQGNRRPIATQAKLRKLEEENRVLRQELLATGRKPRRRSVAAGQDALDFDAG